MSESSYPIDYTLDEDDINWALESLEPDYLVAHLIINGVIFLNTHWDKKEWPDEAQKGFRLIVNMNDTFIPSSDGEELHYDQIIPLYRMFRKDPIWGPVAWCIAQRRTLPLPRYAAHMRERGYDLEALLRGELPGLTESLS